MKKEYNETRAKCVYCQAKQSYHFTVAVTISAAEDLDAPRKNATAKNRRTKGRRLDKIHA